jgi:hypothetical protein
MALTEALIKEPDTHHDAYPANARSAITRQRMTNITMSSRLQDAVLVDLESRGIPETSDAPARKLRVEGSVMAISCSSRRRSRR